MRKLHHGKIWKDKIEDDFEDILNPMAMEKQMDAEI